MAGAGRAERPEGKGRDLTVGAAYRHGDWRTGLSFGRHKTELTIPGATAEIDREELTFSLGWTDEKWLISGQAGVSRGEASGRSSDGTIASYSGDVVSRYLEVGIGRKLTHGDWSVTPEAWLRWQQAALKDLRYRHGGGTSASIGRHESEAGILGFGVDLAYRGWQGEGLNLLPGLRVSYENVISQSQDDFVFGGLIAGRSLGGALGGRLKDNVLIEPSMSFDLPGQGRAVLGAWYSSGDKNKGMNLRVSYRF